MKLTDYQKEYSKRLNMSQEFDELFQEWVNDGLVEDQDDIFWEKWVEFYDDNVDRYDEIEKEELRLAEEQLNKLMRGFNLLKGGLW